MIHIQNTAPGPPSRIAPETPTILPVPTRDAVEMITVCKPETEFLFLIFKLDLTWRNISGENFIGKNFVLTKKYNPTEINNMHKKENPI